jgi:hypothetical protein
MKMNCDFRLLGEPRGSAISMVVFFSMKPMEQELHGE